MKYSEKGQVRFMKPSATLIPSIIRGEGISRLKREEGKAQEFRLMSVYEFTTILSRYFREPGNGWFGRNYRDSENKKRAG